jgi:hypothetical protein
LSAWFLQKVLFGIPGTCSRKCNPSIQWFVFLLVGNIFSNKNVSLIFVQRLNEFFLHKYYVTVHPVSVKTVILCCGGCQKLNFADLAFCTGFWSRVLGFMGHNDSGVTCPLVTVSLVQKTIWK